MPPELRLPDALLQQMHRLRNRVVSVTVAGELGLTLLIVSLQLGSVLLLDFLVDLPVLVRVLLLISVPVVATGLLIWRVLRPVLLRFRERELVVLVEKAYPELRERLLSLVELQESAAKGEEQSSELMRSLLLQQTVDFAKGHDFTDVVDATRSIRYCWMGVVALFALLLPLVLATNAYAVLLSRFLNPWGDYERPQNLMLIIDEPDRVVGRGDDVTLNVRPEWRFHEGTLPESAWLEWATPTGEEQRRRLDWNEAAGRFSIVLPQVSTDLDYVVSAMGSRTRRHRITVVDRPEIQEFSADIVPPAYTGAAALHQSTVLGELLVIEQSRMNFQLKFIKPVVNAEIIWLKEELENLPEKENKDNPLARTPLQLVDDHRSGNVTMTATLEGPSGRFLVRTRDEHGLTARVENVFRLTIQPDIPPTLEIADQEQHAAARPQDVIRIPLRATDDFGIATLELHYDVMRDEGKESGVISIPPDQLAQRNISLSLPLDLARWNLINGSQVAIRARATDERPVPGPNETWTGTRLIQIQDDARPYGDQTLAEQQHRVDQAMENLKAELEQQRQAARQLQAQTQIDAARHEEWKGDRKAAELEAKIQELGQQMQRLSAVLEDQPIMQPLAEKARQIAERDLAQAAQQTRDARQTTLPQKQQKLAEAAQKLQNAQEQLKKLQDQHQSLSQTQRDLLDLNRLAENTEQLANQVDELMQRQPRVSDGTSPPSADPRMEMWNQDHQQLVDRHEQLDQDLEKILAEHPDLLDRARENVEYQLARIGEQADRLARQQQSLASQSKAAGQKQARETKLIEKQKQLLEEERKLASALKLPESPKLLVNGTRETQAAREQLEQGNFKSAQEQHQAAAERLKELAEALKENSRLPVHPQQAVRELQQRQQDLAEQLSKIPAKSSPAADTQLSRLAAEEVALKNAIENLPETPASTEIRKQLDSHLQEAGRKLAESDPSAAQSPVKQALETFQKLEEALNSMESDSSEQQAHAATEAKESRERAQARSQELQQKAADLAKRQQELSREIAAATPQRVPSESSSGSSGEPGKTSPEKSPAAFPEISANSSNQPASPSTPKSQTESPANPHPPSPNHQSKFDASSQESEQSSPRASLPDVQDEMAAQARQLGEEIRQLDLKNEKIKGASTEFPNMARAAAEQLSEGNFEKAAEFARKAAEKAEQFADSLSQPDGSPVPERLQSAAREASQQQQALAENLKSLAESKPQQDAYRSERQEHLQQQAERLSHELGNQAEQMELKQFDRQDQAAAARSAQKEFDQARRQMRQAQAAQQQGNQGQSADAGKNSAESLQKAADLAQQAAGGGQAHKPPQSPAQGEAGQHVAESAQFLQQAGEQLARMGQARRQSQQKSSQREQASRESDQQNENGNGSSGQSPQSGEQSDQQGVGTEQANAGSSQSAASQSLRDAARNMREAAQQLGLASNSQRSNDPNNQSQSPGRNLNQSTGGIPNETASNGEANLVELEKSLGKMSGRNWGRLPGSLKTELFESGRRNRDAVYDGLIRKYFEDISKVRPAHLDPPAERDARSF